MSSVLDRQDALDLKEWFGDAILFMKENRGDLYLGVDRATLVQVATFLRDKSGYDYFVECLCVDYSIWKQARDLEGRFEVVYNLFSVQHNRRLFLKVAVNDGETIPTLLNIWLGAEYPEREIQDLYGVVFEGNGPRPGMRFLLPDDWVGYPLRKEVPLGGEDVHFDKRTNGPAVEDMQSPHAGESWEGKTGSVEISGR